MRERQLRGKRGGGGALHELQNVRGWNREEIRERNCTVPARRRNLELEQFVRIVAAFAMVSDANRVTQRALDRVSGRHPAECRFDRSHHLFVVQPETSEL